MTAQDILTNIGKKIYHPVYLLYGEESYFIDQITDAIEHSILDEMEQEFNKCVVYGRDVDKKVIVSQAKAYPMMSNYQVVLVKEAQDLRDFFPRANAKGHDVLESYLENPLKSTILVFCFKHTAKVDSRRKIIRLIKSKGVVFESKRLYDNKIPGWISAYVKQKGFSIDHQLASLIGDFLGSDLSKIVNELEKMFINIPQNATISSQEVEDNIGISKDFNFFELQSAVARRDVTRVNRIAIYYANNIKEHPILATIPRLFKFYLRLMIFLRLKERDERSACAALGVIPFQLNDFKSAAANYNQRQVIRNISILREFDMSVKGVGSGQDARQLYPEMFVKLLLK